jgi:hypothetical protein
MNRSDQIYNWLPYVLLFIVLVGYNVYFNIPNSSDFPGLMMLLQLMADGGMKYCINTNWGFAHTMSYYLLTEWTGDAHITQRILTGTGALLTVVLLDRFVVNNLKIPYIKIWKICLTILVASHYFLESIIQPHLDLVALSFVLVGLVSLGKSHSWPVWILIGLMVTISHWFRFHFLTFGLFFPILVFLWSQQNKWRNLTGSILGVVLGISIPILLTYTLFGVTSLSNQKAVLLEHIGELNLTCVYQDAILNTPYASIWAKFNLASSLRTFYNEIVHYPELLFILLTCITIGIQYFRNYRFKWGAWPNDIQRQAGYMFIVLLSTLPFIILRGATLRTSIAFLLLLSPIVLPFFVTHARKYAGVLIFIAVIFAWRIAINLDFYFNTDHRYRVALQTVTSVIPKEDLTYNSERILATEYLFNPYHPYRKVHTAVYCCWECREPFLKERYGHMDKNTLDKMDLSKQFDYILITDNPLDTLNKFDREAVKRQGVVIAQKEHVTVIKLNE